MPTTRKLFSDQLPISHAAAIVSFTQGSITHQCHTWKPRQRKEGSWRSWLLVWAHQCSRNWSQSGVTAESSCAKQFCAAQYPTWLTIPLVACCAKMTAGSADIFQWKLDAPCYSERRKIMASNLVQHESLDARTEFLCLQATLMHFTQVHNWMHIWMPLNGLRNSTCSMEWSVGRRVLWMQQIPHAGTSGLLYQRRSSINHIFQKHCVYMLNSNFLI